MDKAGLIEKGYIPLDKSWHIRIGVLDLLDGKDTSIQFLEPMVQKGILCDDLRSLYTASASWRKNIPIIYVGESGTLYRFLQYADWQQKGGREFATSGTLTERKKKMCQDPAITEWPLEELLKLDNGTTQWASAAVIYGAASGKKVEMAKTEKHKLNLSYEAVDCWNQMNATGRTWQERRDETIAEQATAYLNLLKICEIDFKPKQPEDYCFARIFGAIREDEIEYYASKWESLIGHESNRIEETETAIWQYRNGKAVESKDHRIVQATAMLAKYERNPADFRNPKCTGKSWPEFWNFLADSPKLAE